jgi:hypothetical protein
MRTPVVSFGPVNLALAVVVTLALIAIERYRAWKVRR